MLESGYVRLYRSFLAWEWYTDSNTKDLFLHLILTANWEPKKWRGITIERGQRVYSRASLAREMKVSEQNVRTALNHLISTGEVTSQATPQYSIITVKNYDLYQQVTSDLTSDQPANQPAINQPSTNEPTSELTNHQPSSNQHECSEIEDSSIGYQPANQPSSASQSFQKCPADQPQLKKERNNKGINKRVYREFIPPTLDDVIAYCKDRESSVDPKKFFDYFNAGGWVDSRGNHVKNWKQKLITWEGHSGVKSKEHTENHKRKTFSELIAEEKQKNDT